MERSSKILYHIDVLKAIEDSQVASNGIMRRSGSPLDGISAEFSTRKKAFKIDFPRYISSSKRLEVGEKHKKINFETEDSQLVFEYVWISRLGSSKALVQT
jgi:hypothetical protein